MGTPNLPVDVPAKIPRIAVYLNETLKGQVDSMADDERRSLSQMCAILIEEAVKARLDKNDAAGK